MTRGVSWLVGLAFVGINTLLTQNMPALAWVLSDFRTERSGQSPGFEAISDQQNAVDKMRESKQLAAEKSWDAAISAAEEARSIAEQDREPGDQSTSLPPVFVSLIIDHLARLQNAKGDHQKAVAVGKEALASVKERAPDSVHHADIASYTAALIAELGQYKKAEPIFQEAYDIYSSFGSNLELKLAETARGMAIANDELCRHDKAQALFEQVIGIRATYATAAKDNADPAIAALAHAKLELAESQILSDQYQDAIETMEGVNELLATSATFASDRLHSEAVWAWLEIRNSKLPEAEERLQLILDNQHLVGTDLLASTHYRMGYVQLLQGRLSRRTDRS